MLAASKKEKEEMLAKLMDGAKENGQLLEKLVMVSHYLM